MTTQLVARAVGFGTDEFEEVLEAGFSEHIDGTGYALLFQRSTAEPTLNEQKIGWDTYCLITNVGRIHYGGVLEALFSENRLQLVLSEKAAETLQLDTEVDIRFEVPQDKLIRYTEGLAQLLQWGREDQRPRVIGLAGVSL